MADTLPSLPSINWETHTFEEPSKKLKKEEDVELFKKGDTFKQYIIFVCEV